MSELFQGARVLPQLVIRVGDVIGEPLCRVQDFEQMHVVGWIGVLRMPLAENLDLFTASSDRAMVSCHAAP